MRYPLAAPLQLRARAAEAARVGLGDALRRRAAREDEREARAARLAAAADRWRREVLALVGQEQAVAACVQARARFAIRLRARADRRAEELLAAEGALAAARTELDERRRGLADARARLEALERHREGWIAARARERRKKEEEAADDAVSGLRAAR